MLKVTHIQIALQLRSGFSMQKLTLQQKQVQGFIIFIKINISLFNACILMKYIEETGERTDRETQDPGRHRHNLSIPYVNGGTLLFSASSNKPTSLFH